MNKWLNLTASVVLATFLVGCGSNNTANTLPVDNTPPAGNTPPTGNTPPADTNTTVNNAVAATKVEFIGMNAPTTVTDMAKAYSAATARVYTSDTEFKDYNLSYNVLFDVKTKVGTNPYAAGQLYNYKMEPLQDPYGEPIIAETPDANSLLNVGGKLFMVSHLEYDAFLSDGATAYLVPDWYSRMPMNMLLTNISQDANGKLTAVDQKPIDHSSVEGGWIFCFASQTPWNTHLGGEEDYDLVFSPASGSNEEDTTNGLKAMTELYWDDTKQANAYSYGYNQEVTVNADGTYKVDKRYAMGKGTWEMAQVLGDGKTAIYGNDGTYIFALMFVADKVGDLSAGTLYAQKLNQTNIPGSAYVEGTISWIKLGHATESEIKTLSENLVFSDIFDYLTPTQVENNVSTAGYTVIRAQHSGKEYLKVKPGKEKAAAFLEPVRYAAILGATTEWEKMEGMAIDNASKKAYMAISRQEKGMLADASFAKDDIKVAQNSCGVTYEITLTGGQKDTQGNPIDSEYVGVSITAPEALRGELIPRDANGNTCNVDKIANTDNVFFSPKMKTLFIGEDSGRHTNNFIWAYNVDTKKLSRILSVPAGAETTGLQVVENENGYAYIMGNSQHHADFIRDTPTALRDQLSPLIDKFGGNFGYIGGMPGLK